MRTICLDCHTLIYDGIRAAADLHYRCFDCADKKYDYTPYKVGATYKGSEFGILPWFWFDDNGR